MTPIHAAESLRSGDVLHHPAFGFAAVEGTDEHGASLSWERAGTGSPSHVSWHALRTSYRRCDPDGFLALTVRNPPLARALLEQTPGTAVGLLVGELGGDVPLADLREWLGGRRGAAGFDAWWDMVHGQLGVDPRFTLQGGRLAYTDGTSRMSFPLEGLVATVDDEDDIVVDVDPPPRATEPLFRGDDAWGWLLDLSQKLASLHATGRRVLRRPEELPTRAQDRLQADQDSAADPRDDVQWLARTVAKRLAGVPVATDVPDSVLLGGLPILAELPPEGLGVLLRALATDKALRPANGSALWAAFVAAQGTARLRATAPVDLDAELRVGFDTHIGVVKSLLGQTNQDALVLAGDPGHALLGVADGISTANAGSGDLASSLLSRSLRAWFATESARLQNASRETLRSAMRAALDRANTLVCQTAQRIGGEDFPRMIPMGTTLVLAHARGNRLQLVSMGDSRAWIVGPFGVAPLVPDHNLGTLRLREAAAGRIVRFDDDSAALTSYVGHFDALGRPTLPELFEREVLLLPGEWLVLATDGLSDYGADEEAGVVQALTTAATAVGTGAKAAVALARDLVRLANDGGGGDNVTVLTITLSPDGGGQSAPAPGTQTP